MKLAIIQGFEGHFELLGFFIEYCVARNIYFEIFTWFSLEYNSIGGPLDEGIQWVQTYNKLFYPYSIQWKHTSEYSQSNFTRTINLTSVSYKYNYDITLAHEKDQKIPNCVNIGLRAYQGSPYIFPFFKGISKEEKALVRSKRISVVLLGHTNSQTPLSILLKLFNNFYDIDFHFINRQIIKPKKIPSNVYIHECINSDELIEIFKKSHYFFCLDYQYFETQMFTTSISHAFSFGSRLIMPKTWDYDFDTCIRYDMGKIDDSRMTLKVLPIEPVFKEADRYIQMHHRTFDKVLDNIFLSTCAFIHKIPPRIFIETGTYHGNNIEQFLLGVFDEIHSIELKKEFVEKARARYESVYIHHGDSAEVLSKISDKIQEPAIFFLDAHYSGGPTEFGKPEDNGCPLLRELAVLGKRTEHDIIIVDDMRLMGKTSWGGLEGDTVYPLTLYNFEHVTIDNILKTYERQCNWVILGDRLVLHT